MNCPICGGSGWKSIWYPDYLTGGTMFSGVVRCSCTDTVRPEPIEPDELTLESSDLFADQVSW